MTTIGGPGGIHGPKGPGGPTGASETRDVTDDTQVAEPASAPRAAEVGRIGEAGNIAEIGDVQALAAELAAGRLTQREAVDRLVAATAGPGLGAAERAELRELLTDLIANDPTLGALVGRI
jgi:hypothetical protein